MQNFNEMFEHPPFHDIKKLNLYFVYRIFFVTLWEINFLTKKTICIICHTYLLKIIA